MKKNILLGVLFALVLTGACKSVANPFSFILNSLVKNVAEPLTNECTKICGIAAIGFVAYTVSFILIKRFFEQWITGVQNPYPSMAECKKAVEKWNLNNGKTLTVNVINKNVSGIPKFLATIGGGIFSGASMWATYKLVYPDNVANDVKNLKKQIEKNAEKNSADHKKLGEQINNFIHKNSDDHENILKNIKTINDDMATKKTMEEMKKDFITKFEEFKKIQQQLVLEQNTTNKTLQSINDKMKLLGTKTDFAELNEKLNSLIKLLLKTDYSVIPYQNNPVIKPNQYQQPIFVANGLFLNNQVPKNFFSSMWREKSVEKFNNEYYQESDNLPWSPLNRIKF